MCERKKGYHSGNSFSFISEMKGCFFSHMNRRPGPTWSVTSQGHWYTDIGKDVCRVQMPVEAGSATADCSELPPVWFEFCQGGDLQPFWCNYSHLFTCFPLCQLPGEIFYRLLTVAFLPHCKLHMQLKHPGTSLQGAETIPNLLLYWCSYEIHI